METKERKLTARQRRFVDLYLQLGNACEAAEQAGFKRSYAAGAMRQDAVKRYLNERLAEARSRDVATADEILTYLTGVMRGDTEADRSASSPRMKAAELLGKRLGIFQEVSAILHRTPVLVDDIAEG